MSHVASTYAAVMALVSLSTEDAFEIVDLPAMKNFLVSVKNNFKAHNSNNFFSFMSDSDL